MKRCLSRITPKTIQKCSAAFALDRANHQAAPPVRDKAAVPRNCQVCNAGLGPFKPVVRFQKLSAMACSACKFHICSGECWQVLHGMYKGEYGLLPLVDDEQGAPCDADEEEQEEADEDEESDDDDM